MLWIAVATAVAWAAIVGLAYALHFVLERGLGVEIIIGRRDFTEGVDDAVSQDPVDTGMAGDGCA